MVIKIGLRTRFNHGRLRVGFSSMSSPEKYFKRRKIEKKNPSQLISEEEEVFHVGGRERERVGLAGQRKETEKTREEEESIPGTIAAAHQQ